MRKKPLRNPKQGAALTESFYLLPMLLPQPRELCTIHALCFRTAGHAHIETYLKLDNDSSIIVHVVWLCFCARHSIIHSTVRVAWRCV
jgi:hypothetical protein